MIIVDANLLIYSVDKNSERHNQAREWLDNRLHGRYKVGLPWNSLLAFLRITTNPRIFSRPLEISKGWEQIKMWLSSPVVWSPTPGESHTTIMEKIVSTISLKPNDIPDAHLAAIAIEHGLTLCSTDSDFAKYPELNWQNPLSTAP